MLLVHPAFNNIVIEQKRNADSFDHEGNKTLQQAVISDEQYGFLATVNSSFSPAEAMSGTVRQQSKSCVLVSFT
ncbi:Protein of unknown function [Gryllus bimaculatus]|nr:Protein of unknown function [Gryllus bimaculatus]